MAKVKAVPEGMRVVTPVMSVEGAAEALEMYKKAFGAEERSRAMDPSGKKIMHAEFHIGDSSLFINDVVAEMGMEKWPAQLWIYMENVDAAFQRAKSAGLTVVMEPQDMFWGDRMGRLKDKWGNDWTLAQRVKEMTREETKKAADEFFANMAKQGQGQK